MAQKISMTKVGTGRADRLSGALLLASVRRPEFSDRGGRYIAALVMRMASVGLLAWIGAVHWVLWHDGYRYIHIDGPFFLVDAIAAVLLAVVLLAWPRPLTGLLAAGFTASTILALVISLSVGLFGFHEQIQASYVVEALVLESVALIVLLAWTVIAARTLSRQR